MRERLSNFVLASVILGVITQDPCQGAPTHCPPTLAKKLKNSYTINPSSLPVFRKCQFRGDPEPFVTWTLDGDSIPTSGHMQGPYSDDSGFLILREAGPSDSGQYTCMGSNYLGNASASTYITIEESYSTPLRQIWWMWFVYAGIAWIVISTCMLTTYYCQKRKKRNKDFPKAENEHRTEPEEETALEHQLPRHWECMRSDTITKRPKRVNVVDLHPDEPEYKDVVSEFMKTIPQCYCVQKVQRVQTPSLYRQYMGRKVVMDSENPTDHPNERRLFHGTSEGATHKINHTGFNRSFCGKNGTVYGNGTYFARDASYSANDQYSPPDSHSLKYVYLAKVLTGVFVQGSSDMKVPPARDPRRNAHSPCDSVVDNPSNPSVFVIFSDAQAYPAYLIVFK